MELELASEGIQGAHEVGGAPRGRGRAPTLMDRVWVPRPCFFRQYFLYFPKLVFVDFQDIPRTFVFYT